jgi:hypothetical protein
MKRYFFIILLMSCFLNGYAQISENNFAAWRFNLSGGSGYQLDNNLTWGIQGIMPTVTVNTEATNFKRNRH